MLVVAPAVLAGMPVAPVRVDVHVEPIATGLTLACLEALPNSMLKFSASMASTVTSAKSPPSANLSWISVSLETIVT